MIKHPRLILAVAGGCFLAGCAAQPKQTASRPSVHRINQVRTTAYTKAEKGGAHNAIGASLSGHNVMSAASDWSHFPLGTRFRVVDTKDEYIIDDYGAALVGTETIDLYKPNRLEMKRWGVRRVDIDILQWGSEEKSLQVLAPRAKHPSVHQMIVALQKKSAPRPSSPALD